MYSPISRFVLHFIPAWLDCSPKAYLQPQDSALQDLWDPGCLSTFNEQPGDCHWGGMWTQLWRGGTLWGWPFGVLQYSNYNNNGQLQKWATLGTDVARVANLVWEAEHQDIPWAWRHSPLPKRVVNLTLAAGDIYAIQERNKQFQQTKGSMRDIFAVTLCFSQRKSYLNSLQSNLATLSFFVFPLFLLYNISLQKYFLVKLSHLGSVTIPSSGHLSFSSSAVTDETDHRSNIWRLLNFGAYGIWIWFLQLKAITTGRSAGLFIAQIPCICMYIPKNVNISLKKI